MPVPEALAVGAGLLVPPSFPARLALAAADGLSPWRDLKMSQRQDSPNRVPVAGDFVPSPLGIDFRSGGNLFICILNVVALGTEPCLLSSASGVIFLWVFVRRPICHANPVKPGDLRSTFDLKILL